MSLLTTVATRRRRVAGPASMPQLVVLRQGVIPIAGWPAPSGRRSQQTPRPAAGYSGGPI